MNGGNRDGADLTIGEAPARSRRPDWPTESESVGLEAFFDRYVAEYACYGSGKVALRDGLRSIGATEGTVLLPSYLPDAVSQPIHELGLDPTYYAVRADLGPDLDDFERRLDRRTVAVLSVNYFGFSQPDTAQIASLAAEYGCHHVEDNAHAPISTFEGELLGTRGHLGITSLRKLLAVPNGALLYLNDPDLARRFEPSDCTGVADRLSVGDVRFLLVATVKKALDRTTPVRRSVDALVSTVGADAVTSPPEVRYERGKRQLSKYSARTFATADPASIRRRRRENFRAWATVVDVRPAVKPMFERLPAGICPQAYPVRLEDPGPFLEELGACGVGGAHTWPRLPEAVRADPAFETAAELAREVVALPVHQRLTPERITSVDDCLPK